MGGGGLVVEKVVVSGSAVIVSFKSQKTENYLKVMDLLLHRKMI